MIGIIIFIVALFIMLVKGVVITNLWEWFIMPLFDIRAIGIAEGVGLSFFIGIFGWTKTSGDEDETLENLVSQFIYILILWAFSWFLQYAFL